MSIPSLDHASGPLSHSAHGFVAGFKSDVHALYTAMGSRGRRYALTGLGAILALGLGAAAASAVRLPADMSDQATPDQATTLDELPSAAAARAFALGNPPMLAVAEPKEPQVQLARVDPVIPAEEAEPAAYTSSDDQPQKDASNDRYAVPAPAQAPADQADAGRQYAPN